MSLNKSLMIVLSGASFFAAAAMAQLVAPTSIFQLDGNAASTPLNTCTYGGSPGQACDYWNLLNNTGNNIPGGGVGAGSSAGHSSVRTFVNGTSTTYAFTGGGSKDSNLISQWAYSTTPTPNKDTLNAAYAAAYSQGGDFEIIFGADRLSPNGDANIGIWFFQQKVGTDGSGGFTGAHTDHDIFLISAFTGGGGNSTIVALEWDHTCASGVKNPTSGQCADTNLRLLANVGINNVCGSSAYCAITNSGTTTTTWEGSLASPLFFEGGVNITAAFAAVGITNLPCFSSFLVETRSSQSTTAVLKDFLGGGFPVCGLHVTKTCGTAAPDASGTFFNYPVSGTVKNTGVGTMYLVSVSDVVTYSDSTLPNPQTISLSVTPSTLLAGQVGTWSTVLHSSAVTIDDTATASGNTSADGSGVTVTSDNSDHETCSTSLATQVSITKSCSTTLVASGGDVHVGVAFQGQVCNNGDSSISNISLADYQGASLSRVAVTGPTSLGPATGSCTTTNGVTTCTQPTCAPYSATYVPNTIDVTVNGGVGPGRYFFNDLMVITGAKSAIGSLVALSNQTDTRCNNTYGCAPASCPICAFGECPTQ